MTTRTAEQFDTVGYKLSVIETPYEKMWNELKREINNKRDILKYQNPEVIAVAMHRLMAFDDILDCIEVIENKNK